MIGTDGISICMCPCMLLPAISLVCDWVNICIVCDVHQCGYLTDMDVFMSMFACYYITTPQLRHSTLQSIVLMLITPLLALNYNTEGSKGLNLSSGATKIIVLP